MKKILLSIIILSATSVFSQQIPRLVKDLNTGIDIMSSNPNNFIEVNNSLFFVASDPEHGEELWKSDGTDSGTVLVKDIFPGTNSSGIREFIEVNGTLFFVARSSGSGSLDSLWTTDGTEAGTIALAPINGFIQHIAIFKDTLYFGRTSQDKWKTDGTLNGTFQINGTMGTPVVAGSKLYFNDGNNLRIFVDTATGTQLLKSFSGNITSVNAAVDDTLYFRANDGGGTGNELWKSDGTISGTVLVKDVNPGLANSDIAELFVINNSLFFSALDSTNGRELWKSDGTSNGTVLVKDIYPGSTTVLGVTNPNSSAPFNFFNVSDTLFFLATDSTNGRELWKSDGTESGTVLVKDITLGSSGSVIRNLFVFDSLLFFARGQELWKSDGSDSGTVLVKSFPFGLSTIFPFLVANDTLYIKSNDGIWVSDGSSAGTNLVQDGGIPEDLVDFNGTVFFSAIGDSIGRELFKTDGTVSGTKLVKDISINLNSSSFIGNPVELNGNLFFSYGNLWKSDGTFAGTNPLNVPAGEIIKIGDTLFFSSEGPQGSLTGRELWKTDGSDSGAVLVSDINTRNSGRSSSNPRNFVNAGGTLFFTATVSDGEELYKSDGTDAGTALVGDIRPGSNSSFIQSMTSVDSILFFTAINGVNGRELWKSDGTNANTQLVKDISPGQANSNPLFLVNVNGTLFFRASDGINGTELWKSDGTNTGTELVKDIFLGNFSSAPMSLTNVNGTLFFNARNGTDGFELWKSDGTDAGTEIVKDINPGVENSFPSNLFVYKDTLYFSADDGTNGLELWKSDGTELGTTLLKNINTGAASSNPGNFQILNDTLYFTADNGVNGVELWKTDGTTAGTVLVSDVEAGSESSSPLSLTPVNNSMFFSAQTVAYGRELWRFGPCLATTAVDTVIACESYTWINGITYNSSNNLAKDTLVNSDGCDSIVSLNLTINTNSNGVDTVVACDRFTWIDSITYVVSNNTAVDTLINSNGCDSIVSLDLTIINVDTAVTFSQDTLVSNATGASYQWLDCNNNFAPISGATEQKFLPNQGGSYAVEVTENGCRNTSGCYISSVGLNEIGISKLISIFPNPTNDRINIKTSEIKIAQMELIDVKGSVIREINQNANSIDVSQLDNGIYYLRITSSENEIAFKRIVKL